MSNAVSGLAASIRNASESETFDLAGHSPATIEKQIRDALSEPLPLSEMIRLTFIIGAGKLGRQKYDEGAAKTLTTVLRDLGYEEDRGASAVLECGGTFKQQHDTGKNLKTVVVFPKVLGTPQLSQLQIDGGGPKESLIPSGTPEHKLAYSTSNVFRSNIESKCQTWSQKKGCLAALDALKEKIQALETKLMSGTPLTDSEQDFYDSVSLTSVEEKSAHVKDLMHKQVENGMMTADERNLLLQQVNERITALTKDIAEAEKEGKKKRVENLTGQKAKALERKLTLENITPKPPPPLKNEAQINKLRQELTPLQELEDSAKGRLLSLKENQALARKDEILKEIADLEEQSRGWFESDEAFAKRVERSRSEWAARRRSTAKKGGAKPAPSASSNTKFITPAARKPAVAKTKKPNNPGGLFAAMMQDSDSD